MLLSNQLAAVLASSTKFFGRLYLAFCGLWFVLTFLLLLPFFCIAIWTGARLLVVVINRVWTLLFFPGIGLPVRHIGPWPPKTGGMVLCCHHASYLDIPVITEAFRRDHVFMGKSVLGAIPLFGYMYRKLHILVNRKDASDRKRALEHSQRAIEQGRMLVIFPEGRIDHGIQPGVSPFHDGAFFLAVRNQVPLLPATMPLNWKILPDDGTLIGRPIRPLVVFHDPIPTIGLTEADIPALKARLKAIFVDDLAFYNK